MALKLTRAYGQARDYFDALPERERPRYILVSDFQTFELHDLDERGMTAFALADLPHHVEKFGFILGVQKRTFKDQDPVNIQASELMGRLHDALKESGYARPEPGRRAGHDLELFLVRTVFCLFADDTGIFELRALEIEVLKELRAYRADTETGELDAAALSVVNVDQFYGIEINPFPTRIAETALWMMDHIMNNRSLTLDTFSRRGGAGGASLNAVSSEGQAVYTMSSTVSVNLERSSRREPSTLREKADKIGTLLQGMLADSEPVAAELFDSVLLDKTKDDGYLRLWYLRLWQALEDAKRHLGYPQLDNCKTVIAGEKTPKELTEYRNAIAHWYTGKIDYSYLEDLQLTAIELLCRKYRPAKDFPIHITYSSGGE